MSGEPGRRGDLELDLNYDLYSDVNQPGAVDLTLRNASHPVAMVVRAALQRDGWTVTLKPGTQGPTAAKDRLLPPMDLEGPSGV